MWLSYFYHFIPPFGVVCKGVEVSKYGKNKPSSQNKMWSRKVRKSNAWIFVRSARTTSRLRLTTRVDICLRDSSL